MCLLLMGHIFLFLHKSSNILLDARKSDFCVDESLDFVFFLSFFKRVWNFILTAVKSLGGSKFILLMLFASFAWVCLYPRASYSEA